MDILKDFGLPLFTFFVGFFAERFRQANQSKKENILAIRECLKGLIERATQQPKNIPLLKYEYNTIHNAIKEFCDKYDFDFQFFNEDLINLNISTTGNGRNSDDNASKCAISIINKIQQI